MARLVLLVLGLGAASVLGLGGAVSAGETQPDRAPAAKRPPAKTLRVLRSNPRYFTAGSGRAVYLTGSHVWWNLVGARTWKSNCDRGRVEPFDFDEYLDRLEWHNHNFIRLWAIELTRWEECRETVTVAPHPWRRTGPGRR